MINRVTSNNKKTKPSKRSDKFTDTYRSVDFLNLPDKDSPALISVHIQKCLLNSKKYNSGQFLIRLTDCSRAVELHGVLNSVQSRKNALNKFDTLINELQKGKDHLLAEFKKNNVKYK